MTIGGVFLSDSSGVMAQSFGLEYTTELQTDFKGGYDWLNLLKTTADVHVWRNFSVEASTLSVAKCCENPLVEDLLTYSNIEAGNIPLTIARLGVGFSARNTSLFVGINNVNEDYFTSPMTSFFTNSPCGISPTISCNFDIANYPVASWCVHYRQQIGLFSLQSSLYPGKGYYRLAGHDNLFSLNFKRVGVFSISSIDYTKNGIYSVLGIAMHYGVCMGDGDGVSGETAPSTSKKAFSVSPWFLSEIELPFGLGVLVHGSVSTVKTGCKGYVGVDLMYSRTKVQPGISFNYAAFTDSKEMSLEVCSRIPLLSDKAYLQPSVHLIRTDSSSPKVVGMLRFNLSI